MGAIAVAVFVAGAAAWAVSYVFIASVRSSNSANEANHDVSRASGPSRHADSVAATFDIDPETVLALHDDGVGWGAMVKLLAIAEVKGVSAEELLAEIPKVDGEYQFDFGKLRAELTPDERDALDAMPHSLGQLKNGDWLPPGQAKKSSED